MLCVRRCLRDYAAERMYFTARNIPPRVTLDLDYSTGREHQPDRAAQLLSAWITRRYDDVI